MILASFLGNAALAPPFTNGDSYPLPDGRNCIYQDAAYAAGGGGPANSFVTRDTTGRVTACPAPAAGATIYRPGGSGWVTIVVGVPTDGAGAPFSTLPAPTEQPRPSPEESLITPDVQPPYQDPSRPPIDATVDPVAGRRLLLAPRALTATFARRSSSPPTGQTSVSRQTDTSGQGRSGSSNASVGGTPTAAYVGISLIGAAALYLLVKGKRA